MSEKQKKIVSNATPKWFKRMKMWQVITAVLTPIASGELLAFFAKIELPVWVHVTVGVCAVVTFYIKIFIKDVDGDGIID